MFVSIKPVDKRIGKLLNFYDKKVEIIRFLSLKGLLMFLKDPDRVKGYNIAHEKSHQCTLSFM